MGWAGRAPGLYYLPPTEAPLRPTERKPVAPRTPRCSRSARAPRLPIYLSCDGPPAGSSVSLAQEAKGRTAVALPKSTRDCHIHA